MEMYQENSKYNLYKELGNPHRNYILFYKFSKRTQGISVIIVVKTFAVVDKHLYTVLKDNHVALY